MVVPALLDVYCDESCHLERDGHELMVLGAISVAHDRVPEVTARLRAIKEAFGLPPTFEAKWTKVSPAKVDFYLALVDDFLANDDLRFRAWVAHGKSRLRHADFGQDHDTWYYKMYWELLRVVIIPPRRHRIYLDIKDTRGGAKVSKLREVLANTVHDWNNEVVERIQVVRSNEIATLQLADLLVGAVGYRSRGLSSSTAKTAVVSRLEQGTGLRLDRSTARQAEKVNLFHWLPQPGQR